MQKKNEMLLAVENRFCFKVLELAARTLDAHKIRRTLGLKA
jgi:hypothetical protein